MHAFILALLFATTAPAAPCDTAEHRQFDFWLGEWVVTAPDGRVAGTNRITAIAGGCALLEEWTGSRGMTGKSLNIYDASRGVWHQTWVDSTGTLLELEGELSDGAMRLHSATDRITWTRVGDGGVRQTWEKSTDGGASWKTVFDGRYRRKTGDSIRRP